MNLENRLAPFNPTSFQAQEIALQLLDLNPNDVLFDLGCGDGRLLRQACQWIRGLNCVGIEIDSVQVERAQAMLQEQLEKDDSQEASSMSNVEIRLGDVLDPNVQNPTNGKSLVDDASAIFLFLLPQGLIKVQDLLERIVQSRMASKRRFRIVSYMFAIHYKDWEPTQIHREPTAACPIYLYDFKP